VIALDLIAAMVLLYDVSCWPMLQQKLIYFQGSPAQQQTKNHVTTSDSAREL
jgi:hypothetical protein